MNTPPLVYIDSIAIDPLMLKEFHLISDMKSLFYSGALSIKDASNQMASIVKFGSEVRVQYLKDNGGILAETILRVISFKKIASSHAATFDEVSLSLISDWYFKQDASTKAFFGSVSQIATDALARESFFRKKSIEASSDAPRVRYQILESQSELLNKIKKYAVSSLSPMFLYSTPFREIVLKSLNSMANSAPLFELLPYLDGKDETSVTTRDYPVIPMYSLALYTNGMRSSATRKYVFTTAHMQLIDLASVKLSVSLPTLESQEKSLVLATTQAVAQIRSWECSPGDATAIAINETAELNNELFSAVAIVPLVLDYGLALGDVIKLNVNTSTIPENGSYFVYHMDHFYTEGNSFTKLHLVRIVK